MSSSPRVADVPRAARAVVTTSIHIVVSTLNLVARDGNYDSATVDGAVETVVAKVAFVDLAVTIIVDTVTFFFD
ncbi:MAG: hypothetical protein EOO73_35960 [Myxococcales bacterium]|nr:MAG: hypothetical protein EOO73_35960 [Myxococcales bacterium]